ncbi:MAG: exonuclease domain-containing protein [Verrucomicrobiota bacterium]
MMRRKEPTLVVIDLETTGTDPQKHGLVDIAARLVFDELDRSSEFSQVCEPPSGTVWDSGAWAVNGRLPERCDPGEVDPNWTSEEEAIHGLIGWLGASEKVMIAGINPHFDRDFLIVRGRRYHLDLEAMFSHRVFDLHTLAVFAALQRVKSLNQTSSEIYRTFGEEPEADPHTAEEGVRREWELISKLINQGLEVGNG